MRTFSTLKLCRFLAAPLVLAVGLLLTAPIGHAASYIGTAKNVVNKVYGKTLSKTIRSGENLVENQRIRTGRDSGTDIRFIDDSKLLVGELSDITLDRMIYNPNKGKVSGALELVKGIVRFASVGSLKMDVKVKTPHALLGIRGTAFDLLATSGGTELAVHEGAVEIQSKSGSDMVSAGQVYRVSNSQQGDYTAETSAAMKQAVSQMVSMVGTGLSPVQSASVSKNTQSKQSETETSQQTASLPSIRSPDVAKSVKGKNLENILFLKLSYGTMVIEMLPKFAPQHVKRIKELVRRKFYDGLKFHNVRAGFAAETGDPTGTGRGGSGQILEAEISKVPFSRGAIGMKRNRNNLNSADSQFFITLGNAKHLNGKYTVWGRVIHGIELADRLRAGSPPANADRIGTLRVAADVK